MFTYSIRQVAKASIDYDKMMAQEHHTHALTHLREMSRETMRLTEELNASCKRVEVLEEQWRKQIRQLAVG